MLALRAVWVHRNGLSNPLPINSLSGPRGCRQVLLGTPHLQAVFVPSMHHPSGSAKWYERSIGPVNKAAQNRCKSLAEDYAAPHEHQILTALRRHLSDDEMERLGRGRIDP